MAHTASCSQDSASSPWACVSDSALQSLVRRHPWMAGSVVRVPLGFVGIVERFLCEVEEILGRNPKVTFMRIVGVAGQPRDFRRSHHDALSIFIQPRSQNAARLQALQHAVSVAQSAAERTCRFCGSLQEKVFADEQHACAPCRALLGQSTGEDGVAEGVEPKPSGRPTATHVATAAAVTTNAHEPPKVSRDQAAEEGNAPADPAAWPDIDLAPQVAVFQRAQVMALEKSLPGMVRDHKGRLEGVVKRLKEVEHLKRLALIPDEAQAYCDRLARDFPNFAPVVELLRDQFALSEVGDGVLRLPPLLLIGAPGIGKTELALTLSHDLGTPLQILDMASAQSSSALAGSEAFWANTRPGLIFDTLVFGEVANPIFVLDEIDKSREHNGYDPLSALHGLLEARTARQFRDLSVRELPIDASHIVWMATANDVAQIPAPIRDRFCLFEIPAPDRAQMRAIANNLYARFRATHPAGPWFDPGLPADTLEVLTGFYPRKLRRVLETAFGLAARAKRKILTADDIRRAAWEPNGRTGIGFLA